MNSVKRKLKNQTGASITWALLLFLVCAVIGSVVLTAGTAAAGRMSQQAVSDQRYYCVTSAVQLLIDKIDGETVTAVQQKEKNETDWPAPTLSGSDIVLLQEAAKALLVSGSPSTAISPKQLTLTATDNTNSATASITLKTGTDGSLTFTVKNVSDKPADTYTLNAVFTVDQSQREDKRAYYDGETEKTELTKTTSFTWHFNKVEKVSEKPESSFSEGG